MMKFKDLKIGDKFRMKGWQTVDVKIEPTKTKSGLVVTHQEVSTGIRSCFVKDDNEVEKLK